MGRCLVLWVVTVCGFFTGKAQTRQDYLEPDYWKKQGLEVILPPWTLNAQDPIGGFYANLNRRWIPQKEAVKFPSMLSRHLFSYTAAFMLSGDLEYLTIADSLKNYLIKYGWDTQFGGWYDAISADGKPVELTKSTFVQVYALTGLVLYYAATHDSHAMDYIIKTNQLLENKAWDEEYGGYYNQMHQNWAIKDDRKSFSSLITPASGYLSYLYLSTHKAVYRTQAERIMNTVLTKARDTETGWVRENYTRTWEIITSEAAEPEINLGHNLETAWMWLRLFRLNGREDYLEAAQQMSAKLAAQGFDDETGMWAARYDPRTKNRGLFTYWWIQAYGLMFDVYQFKTTGIEPFIERFEQGAGFWDNYVLDHEFGDTHFMVDRNGKALESLKANQFKTSYHSVENALLLYWYISAWVKQKPITVYFFVPKQGGEIYFPFLIEDERLTIKSAKFSNGRQAKTIQRGRGVATAPDQGGILEVIIR